MTPPTVDYRECVACGGWFYKGGALHNHAVAEHTPLWCVCATPTVVSVYGWSYCGRCHRGFEPTKAAT